MYGWGSDTFTRPEAQFAYDFPFAYFKGPPDAILRMSIDYNGEGTGIVEIEIGNGVYVAYTSTLTASEEEFAIHQNVNILTLDPGTTTPITFQADRVALEPDETFVLDVALLGVVGTSANFDPSLPNVFFRSRQEFTIQESTGRQKITI